MYDSLYTLSFITLVLNKLHYSENNNMLTQPMHAVYGTWAAKFIRSVL